MKNLISTIILLLISFSSYSTYKIDVSKLNNSFIINLLNKREEIYLSLKEDLKPCLSLVSQNNQYLAYCIDNIIKIVDIKNKYLVKTLEATDIVRCLEFSNDGSYLIYYSLDGQITFFNCSTHKKELLFYNINFLEWNHIKQIKLSPNKKFLVYVTDDNETGIYDIQSTKHYPIILKTSLDKISYIDYNNKRDSIILKSNNNTISKTIKLEAYKKY